MQLTKPMREALMARLEKDLEAKDLNGRVREKYHQENDTDMFMYCSVEDWLLDISINKVKAALVDGEIDY